MGTNYYHITPKTTCSHCGHTSDDGRKHIGKSSGGWCFSLHVYPDEGLNDLPDWVGRIVDVEGRIEDEYGRRLDIDELLTIIEDRAWPEPNIWDQATLANNHAVRGPNNLLRHQIGGNCIGHGAGTWDLLVGDFS